MPNTNVNEWIITYYVSRLNPISFTIEEHLNVDTDEKYYIYYITVLGEKIHQSEHYAKTLEEANSKSLRMIKKFLEDFNTSVNESKNVLID